MNGSTALLFPGQGSQFPGMGRDLYECSPLVRDLVDHASELLRLDLGSLMIHGTQEDLTDPEVSQLSIFTLSTATAALLEARGLGPGAVAGHSFGEYGALVAAGCLEWEVALKAVLRRAQVTARANKSHAGAMAAVLGSSSLVVEELCRSSKKGERLVVANYNAPRQAVVSGDVAAVGRLIEAAREAEASEVVRLAVEGAFHSPLMAEAEAELAPMIDELPLRPPRRIFVSSTTGEVVKDIELYRENLKRQLTTPVLWSATMKRLVELGAARFVDVGPGKVVRGLARRNGQRANATAVETLADCEALLAA